MPKNYEKNKQVTVFPDNRVLLPVTLQQRSKITSLAGIKLIINLLKFITMKKVTISILVNELSKYGQLSFFDCANEDGKKVQRRCYKINSSFYDNANCTAIRQDNVKLRNFLNLCAGCFDEGFNPVFNKIKSF